MELTKSEREIMECLWDAVRPLSRVDLMEKEDKSWNSSSVHILLNGLLHKGLIREAGFVRRSKTFARTFEPALTREQYYASLIFSYSHKPEVFALFRELLNRPEVTLEHKQQLRDLLAASGR